MVIPLLESLDLTGKTITADALLTQRKLADYLLVHSAHYVFTVTNNQPSLREDLRLAFEDRGQPDFHQPQILEHGHIESRSIWTTTCLNGYLDFPGAGQAFVIERHKVDKKTGETSIETVYGITSHTPDTGDTARVLAFNRGNIRTGHGPENTTALRRFAIGIIKSKARDSVASTLQRLRATGVWSSTTCV